MFAVPKYWPSWSMFNSSSSYSPVSLLIKLRSSSSSVKSEDLLMLSESWILFRFCSSSEKSCESLSLLLSGRLKSISGRWASDELWDFEYILSSFIVFRDWDFLDGVFANCFTLIIEFFESFDAILLLIFPKTLGNETLDYTLFIIWLIESELELDPCDDFELFRAAHDILCLELYS